MYAIVLDLDTNSRQDVYPGSSWRNPYNDVCQFLSQLGFDWQQVSTYFGDGTVDAVLCVVTIQNLTNEFDWFSASVRDIRMLRIEENNDLMPAVQRAARR